MSDSNALQLCVERLKQSDLFQVLDRLDSTTAYFNSPSPKSVHQVCIIDTETTGLNTEDCEIIELGYQIIEFDSSGTLYKVLVSHNYLNEPEGKISDEVTRVTGLTIEKVQGNKIPWDEVKADMQSVELCIAHNASFDRPILERYSDVFIDKIWGCSAAQIDWLSLTHVSSRSQEFLCWKIGHFFYDAHRALDDVQALCQLLSISISNENKSALSYILQAVRLSKSLIKASNAPFSVKDNLRSRGYRWNAPEKVWQRVLEDSKLQDEQDWLIKHETPNPSIIKLKATDTFSVRAT